jgi:hypothetical protein
MLRQSFYAKLLGTIGRFSERMSQVASTRIIDSRNRISDSHTAHGLKVDGGDNVVMDVDPMRLGEAGVIGRVHV